ncbi:TetR/AcrR family transcriptional regulator [Alteromonas sp. ASW11-130]|uniref:TetR/AcrR family transcriptional regulator n=1 Tax=Alteromonas sp. ASW11-130 TaxID=3015775 RepID=UPI002241C2F1|nr:TetR/AcrR family transcriptional regulator [Alteromonas sp. ASW11-130]MCW8092205.1 TetR family transcriptional regulator [Alteromonas sp. ASW11-130]
MSTKTKVRILNAAEMLFAEQGFQQTSMRQITSQAEVNLASVNYHFGNKKNLIQSVLKRYFDDLMPLVECALNSAQNTSIRAVLEKLIEPVMSLNELRPGGTEIFVKLLGHGYNETQGHLRRFIMTHYGSTISKLTVLIQSCLPSVEDEELFWRLHFALGSFVFSMSSSQALKEIAASDFHQQVNIEDVIRHLIPFVSCGIESGIARVE